MSLVDAMLVPVDRIGVSSAVRQGSAGHQRSTGRSDAGSTIPPGRGVATRTPRRSASTIARSIGSVHPCSARSNVPQCSGSITPPRTSRCAITACSGPRCNDNQTTQSADQAAGWGGVNVQALGQKAWNGQGAHSDATSQQYDPSNANAPVRQYSPGGGGSVLQANASLALSAAGNRNSTCQVATQGSGGLTRECLREKREPVHAMKVD